MIGRSLSHWLRAKYCQDKNAAHRLTAVSRGGQRATGVGCAGVTLTLLSLQSDWDGKCDVGSRRTPYGQSGSFRDSKQFRQSGVVPSQRRVALTVGALGCNTQEYFEEIEEINETHIEGWYHPNRHHRFAGFVFSVRC